MPRLSNTKPKEDTKMSRQSEIDKEIEKAIMFVEARIARGQVRHNLLF